MNKIININDATKFLKYSTLVKECHKAEINKIYLQELKQRVEPYLKIRKPKSKQRKKYPPLTSDIWK